MEQVKALVRSMRHLFSFYFINQRVDPVSWIARGFPLRAENWRV